MRRRPKASKLQGRPRMLKPESRDHLGNGDVFKSETTSQMADLEPQITNVAQERVESPPKTCASPAKSLSKKVARKTSVTVRRSQRIQNAVATTEDRDVERLIDEITLSESDREDKPREPSEPALLDDNLEKKVDLLAELLDEQQEAIDALLSKVAIKTGVAERHCVGDITYKGLYFASQKKVESLMEENMQLSKKLEFALGKLEVLEKRNYEPSEVLDKLKDAFWLSSLTKATEAAVNVSSEAVHDAFAAQDTGAGKRKRLNKGK